VQAFAAAPVPNPDGKDGITLHVDNGPNSMMDPVSGQTWGLLSSQDEVPFQQVLGFEGGAFSAPHEYHWDVFELLKEAHFDPAREPAFHYGLAVEFFGSANNFHTGLAPVPGSVLIIADHHALDAQEEAGTLMHEFGHNLGLHHGGYDGTNDKPNYLSVMNYFFQFSGLRHADQTRTLDYSRYDLSLNESALDEQQGFGAPAGSVASTFITLGYCVAPNGGVPEKVFEAVPWPVSGPVDFNCDGSTAGTVKADINGDNLLSEFKPFIDWDHLVFDGGGIGSAGGVALPETTIDNEAPLSELREHERVLESYRPASPAPEPISSTNSTAGPPRCTLKKKGRVKRGRLRLIARCDQTAAIRLGGRVKITAKAKKGRSRKKQTKKLKTLRRSVRAGVPLTLTVKLPKAALIARRKGAKEFILLTLRATNANGIGSARARLRG
jgi:hypothetical protein